MLLIRNVQLYTPQPAGRMDLLAGGGHILRMEAGLDIPERYAEVVDGEGLLAVPGFIDGHVHILGGGGEGGFATRTPELPLSDAIRGGITTVVGCLGTDGITRSLPGLLAKAKALEAEGLSTFLYSGSYGVPVRTFTGSIEEDLILIDKVLGLGEVAISDHRSSQPAFQDLARLAGETRRGGILSGKAGLVNLHLGDGPGGLEPLRRLLAETELPPTQFLPTHINRNPRLFEEGLAYAKAGGFVDFTTSTLPHFLDEGEVKCSRGLRLLLEAGVDPGHVTFTSDGQGSLPDFGPDGRLKGISIGRVTSLFAEVRDAVLQEGLPLETALRVVTCNPARLLKLGAKGHLAPGADADVVLLRPDTLAVDTVVARGRVMMRGGELLARGTFE